MKKLILLAVTCFVACTCSFAQQHEGDITMTKNFWGVKFTQNGRLLKPREVLNIMQGDDEAYAAFKKAKSNYDGATVLGVVGGFMVGWPIGTAIGGGDP